MALHLELTTTQDRILTSALKLGLTLLDPHLLSVHFTVLFPSESPLPILRKLIVSLIFTYSGRAAVLATKDVSSAWQGFFFLKNQLQSRSSLMCEIGN